MAATKILLDILQAIESRSEPALAETSSFSQADEKVLEQLRARFSKGKTVMLDDLTRAEYECLLRRDFTTFAGRCFHELNPQTDLATNWHLEVIAAKLTEVREGKVTATSRELKGGRG